MWPRCATTPSTESPTVVSATCSSDTDRLSVVDSDPNVTCTEPLPAATGTMRQRVPGGESTPSTAGTCETALACAVTTLNEPSLSRALT